jgi:SOS-response transcriptional repressor LexA
MAEQYNTTEEVFQFIIDFCQEHTYPPTIQEMLDADVCSSSSHALYHLQKLEEDGLIERKPFSGRAIRVIGAKWTYEGNPL